MNGWWHLALAGVGGWLVLAIALAPTCGRLLGRRPAAGGEDR